MMITSKSLLSVKDVVAEIGICRTMVFRLFKDGSLKTVKIGRRTFVRPDDLRALIESAAQRGAT
jgi:predicted DNA-binding transcriptional regulator AlpA